MDTTEAEKLEEKFRNLFVQLQTECAIFERIVYKNKNQHRRCGYFRYLLKVRRDLRLLKSVKLEDILHSCFQVITGKKPKQKLHQLESLNWRKCDGGKHNFLERLLGAARLLSQMVEPMLRAATEISTLLAQSFFMGFSLTVLALLARFRVLVQQMMLDVVVIFNMTSLLSAKKQYVKIDQKGVEAYREYYPTNAEFPMLECVWEMDKFNLVEISHTSAIEKKDVELDLSETSRVKYQSVDFFLRDDCCFENVNKDDAYIEGAVHITESDTLATNLPDEKLKRNQVEVGVGVLETLFEDNKASLEVDLLETPTVPQNSVSMKRKLSTSKVAFVPVKMPTRSAQDVIDPNLKQARHDDTGTKIDSFFNLLKAGSFEDSLI